MAQGWFARLAIAIRPQRLLAAVVVTIALVPWSSLAMGNDSTRASNKSISTNGEAEARYAGKSDGKGDKRGDKKWTPTPTTTFGTGPCETAIETLLSPPMDKCLAVANDASSALNLDAFYAMQFLTGYPGQVGDYDECAKVILLDPSAQPTMTTHHCLSGSLSLTSNDGTIPFGGLCVPEACSPENLSSPMFRNWLVKMEAEGKASGTYTQTQLHFLNNVLNQSKLAAKMNQGLTCGTYAKPNFGWDAWAVTGGLCLLLIFIVAASCLDLFRDADYPQDGLKAVTGLGVSQRIKYAGINDENDLYVLREDHINRWLAAFSIPRNLKWLFNCGEANELSVFDGLRVLSMLWVVLGHLLAVQTSIGYVNPEAVYPPGGLLATWAGQLFFSARFSVDTFFFVSGFLVVYAMLRRFKHDGNAVKVRRVSSWLPFFYLHRLLRITPSYLFSLLIWWKLAVFMGEGPFWYRWEYFIGLCDKFWWSNVTYVNNLIPWHQGETQECFYHTWYLANDMQFYILSPLFIVLYMRRKVLGMLVTLLALLASTLAMAIGTYVRGWSALTLDGSWVIKYSQETYTTPYFRIVPYLGGMVFAMFWHEKQIRWPHFKLKDWQRYMMLSFSIVLFAAVTFSGLSGYQSYPCSIYESPASQSCGSGWDTGQLALYNAGTRPAWVLALVLLCFVCFNGQGGLIQQFLSHRAWVPPARLSFGAYLLHPLVINLWVLNSRAKFHFSRLDLFMSYVCVAGVTFGSALVMALIIESPLTKLGRYLESMLKPRERVHKASAEFFAAEQSPGNIERHVLSRTGSGSGFLSEQDVAEDDDIVLAGGAGIHTSRPMLGPLSHSSNVANTGNGAAGLSGAAVTGGELAALVSHSNPGYRDYMSQGGRRGSEAFG